MSVAAVFVDRKGREWSTRLAPAALAKLRDRLGVELPGDAAALLPRMTAGGLFPGQVVWAVIEDQADAAGISFEDADAAIDVRCLERAVEAFFAAAVDLAAAGGGVPAEDAAGLKGLLRDHFDALTGGGRHGDFRG